MGDFSNGFWTGMLNTVNKDITDRFDKAEEYYNMQMERAYEIGLKNRDALAAKSQSALSQAKQLKQMGMPEHLIKSVAAQNPDDMSTIAEQLATLQSKGYKTDERFFDAWIQSHEDFSNNKEDLTSFFKRVYNPLKRNVEADPEGMSRDPVGGFFATVMGYNAMDSARRRLENTPMGEGYSAADLLAINPDQMGVGSNTVTLNYNEYGNRAREAADNLKPVRPPKPLTPQTINLLDKNFKEGVQKELMEKWQLDNAEAPPPEVVEEAKRTIALEMLKLYGPEAISGISSITEWLPREEEVMAPESPSEGLVEPFPEVSATTLPELAPETVEAHSEAPVAPTPEEPVVEDAPQEAPPQESQPSSSSMGLGGWDLIKRMGDGTMVVRSPKGQILRMREEEAMNAIMGR